jgi:hypothetical protein
LGLADALASHGEAPFTQDIPLPPELTRLGTPARPVNRGCWFRGRGDSAPLVLGADYRLPCPAPSPGTGGEATRWGANADGSALALVLALMEALDSAALPQDVQVLLFGHPPASPMVRTDFAGPRAFAESLGALPGGERPSGVIVIGQVGAPGLTLDLDMRTFATPGGRALADELFLLGRALAAPPFTGGAEILFPGAHVPFLERGIPAVCLSDDKDLLAGTEADTLAHCSPEALEAVGAVLCRFLLGERAV